MLGFPRVPGFQVVESNSNPSHKILLAFQVFHALTPQFFWLSERRRPSCSTPEGPIIGIHHALSRKHFLKLQSDFSRPDKTIRIANATFSQKLSSSGLTSTSCRTPNFSFKSICRIWNTYLPHPGNSPVTVIIHSLDYKDHRTDSSISLHLWWLWWHQSFLWGKHGGCVFAYLTKLC